MSKETNGEAAMKEFLDAHKFIVRRAKVPTSASPGETPRNADFLATFGETTILVEVKDRESKPDQVFTASRDDDQGSVEFSFRSMGSDQNTRNKVRVAVDQLDQTAKIEQPKFKMIWFTGTHDNAEVDRQRFIAGLYGTEKLHVLGESNVVTCYYFHNSDFFRYRDRLDGAFATYIEGGRISVKVCVNDCSPRKQELADFFTTSELSRSLFFPTGQTPLDATVVMTATHDRKNVDASITWLEMHFGKRVQTLPSQSIDLNLTHS